MACLSSIQLRVSIQEHSSVLVSNLIFDLSPIVVSLQMRMCVDFFRVHSREVILVSTITVNWKRVLSSRYYFTL